MAYVSNILGYVNSKRESVPSGISVKFYNGNTFLDEVRLNVGDVIPQNRIPIVSPSDIYYSGALGTYMDDSDPLRREKYTPTGSGFTLNGEAFDLTQPIKDNIRLVASVTSTAEYATKLTTVLMGNGSSTTTSDLGYIYTPNGTSISYQTFKDANVSIDFSQYGPYDGTASYTIGSNGSNNPFDPSYVWSDDGQSSTIFRSSNVNANVIVYMVQMTSVTVTFTEYNGTNYVIWSDSTISIPKGSYFMTPELNNVQTPVNIPFKYTYYNAPLTVKTVTLSPIRVGSSASYIYGIGIDNANFPSAENLEMLIFVNRTIVAFGGNYQPARVSLDCVHGVFKDANSLRYCGQYNVYDRIDIRRDRSSQSLYEIYMRQYYNGTDVRIKTIELEEGYRVKGVDIYDEDGEFEGRVDNDTPNCSVGGGKIIPYVVEYHGYPYYGFDGNYNHRTNLWWNGGMNDNQQFKSYAASTASSLMGETVSVSGMYGMNNELFYVEGLHSSGAVETEKMYCFMYTNIWSQSTGTSKFIYFLVDVTSLIGTTLTYTPYSKGVTVSSEGELGQYVMSELLNSNGARGTVSSFNIYDFYENSARDLYQTDSSAYNKKLSFYDTLKDNIQSGYGSLEMI